MSGGSRRGERKQVALLLAVVAAGSAVAGVYIGVEANAKVRTMYQSNTLFEANPNANIVSEGFTEHVLADWAPTLAGIKLVGVGTVRQVPEQENMFSQMMLAYADAVTVEAAMRSWMLSQGFNISDSAVTMSGNDAEWSKGIQFAGMAVGVEMSITLTPQPGNRTTVQIWRATRPNINEDEVAHYRGYGAGFLPLSDVLKP